VLPAGLRVLRLADLFTAPPSMSGVALLIRELDLGSSRFRLKPFPAFD
jgi:hypothetical protein